MESKRDQALKRLGLFLATIIWIALAPPRCAVSLDHLLVFVMSADPNPDNVCAIFCTKRPMAEPNSN